MTPLQLDRIRSKHLPPFQYWFRKVQSANTPPLKLLYRAIYKLSQFRYKCEIPSKTRIGPGLYIGHPYCITINPNTVIGKNCNIHKGLTIGQENRGKRKGTPTIGNEVWIGVNVTIVGKITIGDDVLIAPNTYVNRDIPSHSIVFGNPCQIKPSEHATKDYINNKI